MKLKDNILRNKIFVNILTMLIISFITGYVVVSSSVGLTGLYTVMGTFFLLICVARESEIIKNDETKKEVNNRCKNIYKSLLILVIALYLLAIVFGIWTINAQAKSLNGTVKNEIIYVIGPIFILIGLVLLKAPALMKFNRPHMEEVEGELIAYAERSRPTSFDGGYACQTSYYPVYKYQFDKCDKEYESPIGRSKPDIELGKKVVLLIDENGKIHDIKDTNLTIWIGILCILVGLIMSSCVFY